MNLGKVIADYRLVNRIGVREFAKIVGTSHSTLSRFERGENCDAHTLTKIMSWLFASPLPARKKYDLSAERDAISNVVIPPAPGETRRRH